MTGIGKFAVLSDPQGAVFAILQAERQPTRREAPPRPGEFSWHELMTTDREAAWDFYQALFGWEKTDSMDMGGGNRYQMFGWSGMSVGGMFNKAADMPFPPSWVSYAMVPNADAAARRVTAAGGQVLMGPMDVPGGDRIAVCLDPQGAAFAVHSTAQVVQATPAPSARKPRGRPVKKAAPRAPRRK
jgi:predicted enzyme related to lactoylglutathione lyase